MTATKSLSKWFANHRDQYVDVILAGRTFGGRHGEAMQQPREVEFDGSTLRIAFGTTEQLTVDEPSSIRLGWSGQLLIPRAKRAAFGWHYYGREQTAANWCEQSYVLRDGLVTLTRTGPLLPGEEELPLTAHSFVELL